MAKYLNKTKKKKGILPILLALVIVIVIGVVVWILAGGKVPGFSDPTETAGQPTQLPSEEATMAQEIQYPIILSDGLQILHIGDYAGMYMEDGTNEVVSDVMMLILENTSDRDLQLVRISVKYNDFTAEFEVTNLPAGEKLVALERSRHSAVTEAPQSVETKNVVFFAQPMDIRSEMLKISGSNGLMTVKNISGKDITGDFYIYYKNSASDLLYGGITYRVLIEGGIAAGEAVQVSTGHYTPESSRIMSVDFGA